MLTPVIDVNDMLLQHLETHDIRQALLVSRNTYKHYKLTKLGKEFFKVKNICALNRGMRFIECAVKYKFYLVAKKCISYGTIYYSVLYNDMKIFKYMLPQVTKDVRDIAVLVASKGTMEMVEYIVNHFGKFLVGESHIGGPDVYKKLSYLVDRQPTFVTELSGSYDTVSTKLQWYSDNEFNVTIEAIADWLATHETNTVDCIKMIDFYINNTSYGKNPTNVKELINAAIIEVNNKQFWEYIWENFSHMIRIDTDWDYMAPGLYEWYSRKYEYFK